MNETPASVNETPAPMNTTAPPVNAEPKTAAPVDRQTIARIIATLVGERFANLYGGKQDKEIEDAFVQFIMESEYGKSIDNEALKSDAANLVRFKTTAPAEWTRRKPWLNKPGKGSPRLLKALVQVTREASRYKVSK